MNKLKQARTLSILKMLQYFSDTFSRLSFANMEDVGETAITLISSILNYETALLLIGNDSLGPEVMVSRGIKEDIRTLQEHREALLQYLRNDIDSPGIIGADTLEPHIADAAHRLGIGETFLVSPLKTLIENKESHVGFVLAARPRGAHDPDCDIMSLEILAGLITGAISNCARMADLVDINRSLQLEINRRKKAEEKTLRLTEELESRVTERTAELRQSEESFREFVMVQTDPIQVIDINGMIVNCNDASAAAHGSSATELIGKSAFDGMPAAVVAERRALLDRVISTKQTNVVEEEFKGKFFETMISPIMNRSGEVVKIAIFPHDITRRKRAEEKLRDSEEYIRSILDSVDEGFVVIDPEYRINVANKAYCEQVSLPSSEVLGRHCYEVSHRSERPCYELGEECAVRKVFTTGKPHSAIHKHPGKEGQVLYVETRAFPIKDLSGRVTSAIETVNNITERHLLQEERLKTQKLESIGTLAGGIAHDFNNLLQGVFGHISMARMSIDQKDKSLAMLEQAEEALHRTVSLTNQLLTFSKGGKPVKKLFPILPAVEDAARFALSGSSSKYEVLPQGDLWLVDGDAGQIGQVIQNITLNADQSMPQGGKISFRVSNVAADSEMPAVLKNGEYVLISIQDNGHGIPEEFRERIFDPYFTTKERGSGLGLATSYSIVRNHGGIIGVESQLGKGATFRIYLPAVLEKIQEQELEAAPTEVCSAKVLIMDDEEIVRVVTGNLMRALGHECEFAEEGESAVAIFKAARDEGRPFDMVLLDLTVRGGMGGAETIRELLAIDPEVKAIVMSGYSDEDTLSDYQSWGFKMFLKKPYKLEELQRAVNSLLG